MKTDQLWYAPGAAALLAVLLVWASPGAIAAESRDAPFSARLLVDRFGTQLDIPLAKGESLSSVILSLTDPPSPARIPVGDHPCQVLWVPVPGTAGGFVCTLQDDPARWVPAGGPPGTTYPIPGGVFADLTLAGPGRGETPFIVAVDKEANAVVVVPIGLLADLSGASTGSGTGPSPSWNFSVGSRPVACAAGDVDGDGRTEVIVGCRNDRSMEVWRPDVDARTASLVSVLPLEASPCDLAASDLDRDGASEVVVVLAQAREDGLSSVLVVDDPAGSAVISRVPAGEFSQQCDVADLDGDGWEEVVTADEGGHTVTVLRNRAGGLEREASIPTAYFPHAVEAADVDGDGRLDLLVASRDTDSVAVHLQTASGGYAPFSAVTVGFEPMDVAAADVDGDGDAEIASADWRGGTLTVRENPGNGAFNAYENYPVGWIPRGLAYADLCGDGMPDLVTADYGNHSVAVVENRRGRFLPAGRYDVGEPPYAEPYSVVARDFDGDGLVDIAVADEASFHVVVLFSDGGGRYEAVDLPTYGFPFGLDAGDLDGDGLPEIGAAIYHDGIVTLLRNLGGRRFEPEHLVVGAMAFNLCFGDVDGDGDADLVTANMGDQRHVGTTATVFENRNGTLTRREEVFARPGVSAVALGDLNGDSRPDLVAVSYLKGELSIVLQGESGWGVTNYYPVGRSPYALVLTDADGDGDLDAITADYGSNTLTLLRMNGRGGVESTFTMVTGAGPFGIVATDLDGDGDVDIAASAKGLDAVSVHRVTHVGADRARLRIRGEGRGVANAWVGRNEARIDVGSLRAGDRGVRLNLSSDTTCLVRVLGYRVLPAEGESRAYLIGLTVLALTALVGTCTWIWLRRRSVCGGGPGAEGPTRTATSGGSRPAGGPPSQTHPPSHDRSPRRKGR